MTSKSKRKFLSNSMIGFGMTPLIGTILSSCISSNEKKINLINKGDTILFQGDSITDAGREKKLELSNNSYSFGNGYALLAASSLLNSMAEKKLKTYNRGISGNKVFQLAERWEKDCLNLKPNILSILIGINDYWHKRNGKYDGTPLIYENDYRKLIERTLEKIPDLKLVICQPFAVNNTAAVDDSWMGPIKEYQASAKKIATEFGALWVPFQEVFDKALEYAPATYWTNDGVHPDMPGAQLMAEAWLKVVM